MDLCGEYSCTEKRSFMHSQQRLAELKETVYIETQDVHLVDSKYLKTLTKLS